MSTTPRELMVAVGSGSLFSVGLAMSGMTKPEKVIGFLDVTGRFDPTLAFVMVGAIAVHAIAWRFIRGRPSPIFATGFLLPAARRPDLRLVLGSVIFGVGWGLAGYCPGPGLVSIGSLSATPIVFVASMIGGMVLYAVFEQRRRHPARLNAEAVDS